MWEIPVKMVKKKHVFTGAAIVLLALAAGITFQFSAFTCEYVVNNDAGQHIYWMRQFHDSELFSDDLLTEFAKNYQPWGFIFLYYILSFFMDPLVFSKFLPVLLFAISSLYLFKLVSHFAGSYSGLLATLIFIVTPFPFLDWMAGGHPRAFAFPLLIIFLYYLIRKKHLGTSVALVLQCLFYPMVFLLGMVTYLFTFVRFRARRVFFDRSAVKVKFFIPMALVCLFILCGKYLFSQNPDIGKIVTRAQMSGRPEYSAEGRAPVLPTPPLLKTAVRNIRSGTFVPRVLMKRLRDLGAKSPVAAHAVFMAFVLFSVCCLFLFREDLVFPPEIMCLLPASILMFKTADILLLKLFLPERYLEVSFPLFGLIVEAAVLGQLVLHVRKKALRRLLQAATVLLVLLNLNIKTTIGLTNMSSGKELYEYLAGLPKDTMIAAHPEMADGIPLFARRKVFVKGELSFPFFDNYWNTIKKRTFDLFDAYYTEEPLRVYRFCEENGIDYLVVDNGHFTGQYLTGKKVYFEPFGTYIRDITAVRRHFALQNVPQEYKLFTKGDIFVINRNILKMLK
jgi:hypothetical protein